MARNQKSETASPTRRSPRAAAVTLAAIRGKRSGVTVSRSTTRDVNRFFSDSKRLPDSELQEETTSSSASSERAPKVPPLRPARRGGPGRSRKMRFSLEGQAKETTKTTTRSSPRKGRKVLKSPSELSKVSTLPPTPKESDDDHDHDDGEELLTQEVEVPRQAAGSAEKNRLGELTPEPATDFGAPDGDDEDEEEPAGVGDYAMIPPMMDDDDDDDEDSGEQLPEAEPLEPEGRSVNDLDDDEEDDRKPAARTNDDDDDDDDDKEGPGFSMADQAETPKSVLKSAKKKGRKSLGSSTSLVTPANKTKKSKKRQRAVMFSPEGHPIANRGYDVIPLSQLRSVTPNDEDPNRRRSKRVRCKPLEFWKNEKYEIGQIDPDDEAAEAVGYMPVVKGIIKALPTPRQKRKVSRKVTPKEKTPSRKREEEVFDATKLKKKYKKKLKSGNSTRVWDDAEDQVSNLKVIARYDEMVQAELPNPDADEGQVVGLAAQGFQVAQESYGRSVGYIMGNLLLPPTGVKIAESVGPCSQTFSVCTGQKGALEVAFMDPEAYRRDASLEREEFVDKYATRFLLGPNDLFRVPPGNSYRLRNYSTTQSCLLTWTIIRPFDDAAA